MSDQTSQGVMFWAVLTSRNYIIFLISYNAYKTSVLLPSHVFPVQVNYCSISCPTCAGKTTFSSHIVPVQVKPLGVIWGKFEQYNSRNTIMFDDLRRNFLMNPQNGLKVGGRVTWSN